MRQTTITRRQALRLLSIGLGALSLGSRIGGLRPAFAQALPSDAAYADDISLSMDEIEAVRAMSLHFGIHVDQLNSDFSNLLIETARRTAAGYGVTLEVSGSNSGNSDRQITEIVSQVTRDFDGIFVVAIDTDEIGAAVAAANAANVPILVLGGTPAQGRPLAVMTSTSFVGCYQAAGVLVESVGSAGKIGVITSGRRLELYREAERGVLQALGDSRMELVDMLPVMTPNAAYDTAVALMDSHPDLAAIFTTWGGALDGTMAAITAVGRDVKVAGFDAGIAGFMAFQEGNVALQALAGRQAGGIGRVAVDILCKAVLGQPVESAIIVPTLLVTADNFRQRWDEIYPGRTAPWDQAAPTTPPGA